MTAYRHCFSGAYDCPILWQIIYWHEQLAKIVGNLANSLSQLCDPTMQEFRICTSEASKHSMLRINYFKETL